MSWPTRRYKNRQKLGLVETSTVHPEYDYLFLERGMKKAYLAIFIAQATRFVPHKGPMGREICIERKVYSGGGADQMA